MPDYLLKYATIASSEQRQSYKNDFNAEYSEYRDLHARIEQITRRFTQLDAQLRQLSQGSEEYETTRGQILQEYRKIKKVSLSPAVGAVGNSPSGHPSALQLSCRIVMHF